MAAHWLIGVAARAGYAAAADLDVEPGTPTSEVWERVAAVAGITDDRLAEAVARAFRLPLAELDAVTPAAVRLVSEQAVRRFQVLPLRQTDREIHIATCDPADVEAEQTLGFVSARQPHFEVAPPDALRAAIEKHYPPDAAVQPLLRAIDIDAAGQDPIALEREAELAGAVASARGGESSAVVTLTNAILGAAVQRRASRVAIGGTSAGGTISFTIDGVESHYMHLPVPAMNRVIARLQVLAGIGVGQRAQMAGGTRLRTAAGDHAIRVRIGAGGGPSAELRIFEAAPVPGLAALTAGQDTAGVAELIDAPAGLLLVCAPPGGGLSTTLRALARDRIDAGGQAALVIEDLEVEVAGACHVVIDADRGPSAPDAVRLALESGAGTIILDGVWGPESARLALAAATDRLVVIGVRADSLEQAFAALLDQRIARAELAAVFRAGWTQRLLRRLCPECASPAEAPAAAEAGLASSIGVIAARKAIGCDACAGTGYRGQVVAAGLAPGAGAAANIDPETLAHAGDARWGPDRAAAARVRAGETTLAEYERVFGPARPTESDAPRVLVADDDIEIRTLARAVLEQGGLRVEEAEDGQATLDRLGDGASFALVVLDLDMPKLHGRDVMRRMKQDVRTAGVPVLVLTGLEDPKWEVLLMEEGAADYVRKPIDPPRFLARVRAALRRHAGS